MPALITFGRVLFAVLFMYSGATKLFAIQQTADFIATKVTIPALLDSQFVAIAVQNPNPGPVSVSVTIPATDPPSGRR